MTKQTQDLLSRLPMFVGYDDMFRSMENMLRVDSTKLMNWPPYNVVKTGEHTYAIQLALAGFSKTDIEVELDGNVLRVKGETKPDESVTYISKGIAERNFNRTFNIADGVEVKGAEMINGILEVVLQHQAKATEAVKKIAVK